MVSEDLPVTREELKAAWDKFMTGLKAAGRDREYNMLSQEVEINDGLQIKLRLANSFQSITVESIQQELLTELRTSLKNSSITLVTEIEKVEDKRMIYTSAEKFEYLAGKYPLLRDLKNRLDLDTDF